MAASGSLIENAFALHQAGRLTEAEALYRTILVGSPENLNALHLLGALLTSTGRADDGVRWLEQAVSLLERRGGPVPAHAAIFNNLGNALRAAGRDADALAAYRRALTLDPLEADLTANMAAELARQGKLGDAVVGYARSLSLAPDHAASLAAGARLAATLDRADDAVAGFRRAVALRPDDLDLLSGFGHLLVGLGRLEEAAEVFHDAVARNAAARGTTDTAAETRHLIDLARVLRLAGRTEEALDLFAQALDRRPDDAALMRERALLLYSAGRLEAAAELAGLILARIPTDPDALFLAGRVVQADGELFEAERRYRAALAARPDAINTLYHLGLVLHATHQPAETVTVMERMLALAPDHAGAWHLRGGDRAKAGHPDDGVVSLDRCLTINPAHHAALYDRNMVVAQRTEDGAQARAGFRRAIALHPDDPDAYVHLGDRLLDEERAEARRQHGRAHHLRPITTWPATSGEPKFSVLLMMAPGAGNVPFRYLVSGGADYDAHFISLDADTEHDVERLRGMADVVFNLVADADREQDRLPMASALAARIGRPVINDPARIAATDRVAVAERLAGIPGCRVARTARFSAADLMADDAPARLAAFTLPVLVRVAGEHGGDDFELLADYPAIAAFAARRPDADHYALDYIDYQSPDGHFRKYRMIFVDGEIFPYHLAIGDVWKVHHYTTDMANQQWMRDEEADFLNHPEKVFTPRHYEALEAIRDTFGLDYFGVDCAIDRNGDLLVFEVNACMLVHNDNAGFDYKDPHVLAIKAAFEAMLAKAAGRAVATGKPA